MGIKKLGRCLVRQKQRQMTMYQSLEEWGGRSVFISDIFIGGFLTAVFLFGNSCCFASESATELLKLSLQCSAEAYDADTRRFYMKLLDRNTYLGNDKIFQMQTRRHGAITSDEGVREFNETIFSKFAFVDIERINVLHNSVSVICREGPDCISITKSENDAVLGHSTSNYLSVGVCSEQAADDVQAAVKYLAHANRK
jgi:hypothetical protein